MIYFFADNHYGARPGKRIFDALPEALKKQILFREDDFSILENGEWLHDCDLLVLHMIGETCGIPHPGKQAEKAVRKYYDQGGSFLLLHGSSAAFWKWEWWRKAVGLRWVRPGDPDGVPPSTHPTAACSVIRTKTCHPLGKKLRDFHLPEDEIYTDLEETAPIMTLMTTDTAGKTYPQCCETISPAGGRLISFIPGHKPECTANQDLLFNIELLISFLQEKKGVHP